MKKVFFLVAVLMLPTVLAEQFPVQNVNSSFIGWLEGENSGLEEFRISYPSVSDGEKTPKVTHRCSRDEVSFWNNQS